LDKVQEWVPRFKTSKKVYSSISVRTLSFRRTAQRRVELSAWDFYLRGHLETSYIQIQVKMKHFTKAILMPVEPFRKDPGLLKVCNSPRSDVSVPEVIQVENI
jgi:hypothetical protein